MSEKSSKNLPISIKQKLLNQAREKGLDFNSLLIRFAMERLLFRLSISTHAQNFYLKGAMLFVLWENDIHYLLHKFSFSGSDLREAIHLTFQRRKTTLPRATPDGLSKSFSEDARKQIQWAAFLRKNNLQAPTELREVIERISEFLMPVLEDKTVTDKSWNSTDGWI